MHKKLDKPIQVTQECEEQIKEFVLNLIKVKEQWHESKDSLIYRFMQTKTCRTITDAEGMFRCMMELGLGLKTDESEFPLIWEAQSPIMYNMKWFANFREWS